MEKDPTGRGQHEPGAKLDSGKVRAALVLGDFSNALKEVCKVGTYGANKYTESGWRKVPNGENRYQDALLRHWLDLHIGVEIDSESGLYHLSHFAWNALAILEKYIERKESEQSTICQQELPKPPIQADNNQCLPDLRSEASLPEKGELWKRTDLESNDVCLHGILAGNKRIPPKGSQADRFPIG